MRSRFTCAVLVLATIASFGSGAARAAIDPTPAIGCDPIDPAVCLYPFPNDFFTTPDTTTATGLHVNFLPTAMPRDIAGKPIDPTEWNRNDGWSPGALIETLVPGLDLDASRAPSIKDPRTSLTVNSPGGSSPIVVINTTTLQPHPVWAELDAQAPDDLHRALLVRAAKNYDEGTRYIVALRNLRYRDGNTIPANPYFAALRDGVPTADPLLEQRRAHMESLFGTLGAAGVSRGDLYLAWDFTVASERNLSERILHIRDDAFASLGDTNMGDGVVQGDAPTFTVTQVTNNAASDTRIARQVQGAYVVPNYLAPAGVPGARFVYGPDGLPLRFGSIVSTFTCDIPRAALSDGTDANATVSAGRPSLYGHGLLGSQSEVTAGNVKDMGQENNFVFCATDWSGMATTDIGNVAHSIADVSNFSTMCDRMQQGFVNQMFLGRLMIHPNGLTSDPAFQGPHGEKVIDTHELFYDGNSQGGIMGGSLVAVSPDIHRAVLGVPGMNYSTLLDRSVDWATYYAAYSVAYRDRLDQQLIFGLMQMLWDRGEADGYAHHITTDPLPNTPAHEVLMHMALGDHQVANITTEVEARTFGAAVYLPPVDPAKLPDGVVPFWGLTDVSTLGPDYHGSVLVMWDAGNNWAPLSNTPAADGGDPHGKPRGTKAARTQKAAFLQTNGVFIDTCGGAPCKTS